MQTTRSTLRRSTSAGLLAITLVLAACGSDGSSPSADEDAQGQDSVAPTVPANSNLATTPTTTNSAAAPTSVDSAVDTTSTSTATDTDGPLPEPAISLYDVGEFDRPVDVATIPGDVRLFVVEQPGRVVAVTDLSTETVLDITDRTAADGERGLLGLAFHPTADFAYVDFTDDDGNTVVAEFAVDATTGQFDVASFREVLTVDQPYSNHNGGKLAFGTDGLLYIGLGDGGSGGDPERHALDMSSRLGKILRIDPLASDGEPFTIPADNPFVDDPNTDPTIWASGLRNPWRFSFDPETGDLWIADVGQGDIEEINHATATDRADAGRGLNFGWSAFEGLDRFNEDQSPDGVTPPVYVYDHSEGRCSVSGGAIVRDSVVPDLDGWYVFGDYCTGEIWGLEPGRAVDDPRVIALAELPGLAAITVGPERELYAVSNAGKVMRVIAP